MYALLFNEHILGFVITPNIPLSKKLAIQLAEYANTWIFALLHFYTVD